MQDLPENFIGWYKSLKIVKANKGPANGSIATALVVLPEPTDRPGDFLVGNTAFHVTIAPMPAIFEKCKNNISQGYKSFLIVPDNKMVGARQNAEQFCANQIAVESIESFVSQNIAEISHFDDNKLRKTIKELIKIYNKRVDEVETDKSLMIELPKNY